MEWGWYYSLVPAAHVPFSVTQSLVLVLRQVVNVAAKAYVRTAVVRYSVVEATGPRGWVICELQTAKWRTGKM